MNLIKRVKFIFVLLVLFSGLSSLNAQFIDEVGSKLLSEKEKSILSYFDELGLLPELIDFDKSLVLKEVYQKIGQLKLEESFQNSLKVNEMDVKLAHFFYNGDSLNISQVGSQNNHYSTLGINTNSSVFNTPIQLGGDIVLLNGKFDKKLSTARINFDPQRYLNQWKDKINPIHQFEEMFNMDENPLGLSLQDQEIFKTDYLYTVFQQVIAHPKFRSFAKEKLVKNDSLYNTLNSLLQNRESILMNVKKYDRQIGKEELQLVDELSNLVGFENEKSKLIESVKTYNDSTFYKAQKLIQNIKKIEQEVNRIEEIKDKYNDLWESKKNINFESIKSVKDKVGLYSDKINFDKYNDKFKKFILKEKELKNVEKILLYTKKLDVGFFSINRSDHIANYLSLNGVRFAYENERFEGEVAYGNQSLSSQFLPSIGSLLLNRHYGRRVLYLRTGLHSSDKAFSNSFSILKVDDVNVPEDSLFVFPKKNTVIGWSGKAKLLEDISLKADVALSDLQLGKTNIDQGPFSKQDLSWAISGVYEPKSESPVYIEGGYFFNGENYSSLGNPYLLTNRQGVSLKAGVNLLKNKISINGDLKLSKSLNDNENSPFRDLQYLGEVIYRFGNSNVLSARFIPNIFSQETSFETDITANNNIYNIQANFQSKVKNDQLFTVLNVTNLRSDIQLLDTISIDARTYFYLQEILMLSNENSLNLTFMSGAKEFSASSITDFLTQLDGTLQFDNWSYNVGGQLIKQQFNEDWQYGIINRIQCKVFEKGFLNINTNIRRTITESKPKNSIQANVSFMYGIGSLKRQKINE